MAKGIRATINKMAEIVESVDPIFQPDHPFSRVEADTKGTVTDIIVDPNKAISRQFVVRLADQMPKDDGESGARPTRFTTAILVQVLYKTNKPTAWLEAQMAEDGALIQYAMQDPLAWDCSSTGIMSIAPAEQPTSLELDSEETTVARLLTLPYMTTYREVPA